MRLLRNHEILNSTSVKSSFSWGFIYVSSQKSNPIMGTKINYILKDHVNWESNNSVSLFFKKIKNFRDILSKSYTWRYLVFYTSINWIWETILQSEPKYFFQLPRRRKKLYWRPKYVISMIYGRCFTKLKLHSVPIE